MGALLDLYYMVYPPAPIARAAEQLLMGVGGSCPAATAPMPPQRMHLTLQGFGRFEQRIPEHVLQQVLLWGAAVNAEPFGLLLDLLQSRSGGSAPTTVELAGRGPGVKPLRQFRRCMVETLLRGGFPEAGIQQTFVPHITLDYRREPISRRVVVPLAWQVDEFCLVASHYGDAHHEVLARWPLQQRQLSLFS